MTDSLILEVANLETLVLTGIYSEETGRPQPLRITMRVGLKHQERYTADCPLSASKNYMDLKFAATDGLPKGVHFKLIEAVADHIIETLMVQDDRITWVEVKIVKLAISENGEEIGITLKRERPNGALV
ncbi:MAG: dihydroneopterin aldolase [Novosphingobium sp. 16-62-11]|uniref:dihydroneopterin aldolase n=1 Tax=Novosphingobium sp. 17-62-19 TaxID=1970406 RepID=UPI000BCC2DE2|nr:dihydroneopterin aldolase [Novosphingobium sp. 17-62-19]OYZ44888.1 MAG: dihydroneopterin aldolase [Novosphingobium sp. 16-62-11]OZA20931.1 MAG: dihydroneopterin aldolase [Novosphingobium sp. 17-62-19]HQS97451.1 dihydroneopterin aldolase [Novosphingobium sp.]